MSDTIRDKEEQLKTIISDNHTALLALLNSILVYPSPEWGDESLSKQLDRVNDYVQYLVDMYDAIAFYLPGIYNRIGSGVINTKLDTIIDKLNTVSGALPLSNTEYFTGIDNLIEDNARTRSAIIGVQLLLARQACPCDPDQPLLPPPPPLVEISGDTIHCQRAGLYEDWFFRFLNAYIYTLKLGTPVDATTIVAYQRATANGNAYGYVGDIAGISALTVDIVGREVYEITAFYGTDNLQTIITEYNQPEVRQHIRNLIYCNSNADGAQHQIELYLGGQLALHNDLIVSELMRPFIIDAKNGPDQDHLDDYDGSACSCEEPGDCATGATVPASISLSSNSHNFVVLDSPLSFISSNESGNGVTSDKLIFISIADPENWQARRTSGTLDLDRCNFFRDDVPGDHATFTLTDTYQTLDTFTSGHTGTFCFGAENSGAIGTHIEICPVPA